MTTDAAAPSGMPMCVVHGCERPVHGKGMCKRHGHNIRVYGTVEKPVCEVHGCSSPRHGSTYCQAHYRLVKKYGVPEKLSKDQRRKPGPSPDPTKPRSRHASSRVLEEQGGRRTYLTLGSVCPNGHLLTDASTLMYTRPDTGQKRLICRACLQARYQSTGWKKRVLVYGISIEQFLSMLEEQNGCCKICGVEFSSDRTSAEFTPHIDHDHACCPDRKNACGDCVRGLLCRRCNSILGFANDDQVILGNALAYLLSRSI